MATLTTWQAEKDGYFQGTATLGQTVGRAIDWFLDHLRKLPQLPKVEPMKGHWRTWADGDPMSVTDSWITMMIEEGRLPHRDQVTYLGNRPDQALTRVMSGTHVFVEMLDTVHRSRHRCTIFDNVLLADREGWLKSLGKGA